MIDCFSKTSKAEGFKAFYSGFLANFLRNVSWNIIMFLTLEQCQIFIRDNMLK